MSVEALVPPMFAGETNVASLSWFNVLDQSLCSMVRQRMFVEAMLLVSAFKKRMEWPQCQEVYDPLGLGLNNSYAAMLSLRVSLECAVLMFERLCLY